MIKRPAWTQTRIYLSILLLVQATGCMHWEKQPGRAPEPVQQKRDYRLTLQDGRRVVVRSALITADSVVGRTARRSQRAAVALREVRSFEQFGRDEVANVVGTILLAGVATLTVIAVVWQGPTYNWSFDRSTPGAPPVPR